MDYERDLKVIREIIQNIPHRPILMDDIIKFLNENPDVCENEVDPMLLDWKLEEAYPTISHKMLG